MAAGIKMEDFFNTIRVSSIKIYIVTSKETPNITLFLIFELYLLHIFN